MISDKFFIVFIGVFMNASTLFKKETLPSLKERWIKFTRITE